MSEPILAFNGKYRFLSNFYETPVTYNGFRYKSSEHAYQASKMKTLAMRKQVAAAHGGGNAKRVARALPRRDDWGDVKLDIMLEILRAKFSAPAMGTALLATNPSLLVEGNTWNDIFWGVCRGVGENHLGRLLMQVRDELLEQMSA